jgi:GAF domain-containing protein
VDKEQMQLLGHDDETRLSLPLTSVAGIAVEGGVPLILHDAQGDSRYAPDANTALGAAVQTMICIPLRTNDCIGVVLATNRIFPGGVW